MAINSYKTNLDKETSKANSYVTKLNKEISEVRRLKEIHLCLKCSKIPKNGPIAEGPQPDYASQWAEGPHPDYASQWAEGPQPDYASQWAEYYRSVGMVEEAKFIEQQSQARAAPVQAQQASYYSVQWAEDKVFEDSIVKLVL